MHVCQPVNVAHSTADSALTLVAGIKSKDAYFKHFAFDELQQFARDESNAAAAKRTALFADQKYNPSLWATLVRETLLTLGNDYQLFLRRGAPPKPGMLYDKDYLPLLILGRSSTSRCSSGKKD